MSRVPKPKRSRVPRKVATATKSSIMDTPVTISGFIMGMLVTLMMGFWRYLRFMRWSPRAPKVPRTVAHTEELTASTRELRRAEKASSSWNSSSYQTKEKPENSARLPDSLKEKTISTAMGI